MLASTVQFSSNDQPPATPTQLRVKYTGVGTEGHHHTEVRMAVPSGPNNVPDTTHPQPPTFHAPTAEAESTVLAGRSRPIMPNSQRSTHERTSTGHPPANWPSARR
jgi:hypothetical protein